MKEWLIPPNFLYALRMARGREPKAHVMRLFRDAVAWTLPHRVQKAILNARYSWQGISVARNRHLADRHAAERRCFVLGNGPSLKGLDLTPLRDEWTIACNSFYKHPDAPTVGLDYLCIGDPSFMEDKPNCVEWHRIIESLMPQTKLMLHPSAKTLIQRHGLYGQHDVYFYRHGITVTHPELVGFDFTQPLSVGHTCGTRLGIPLAVYLGFKEIYLLGFDANWLDDIDASYHFYDAHDQFPEFDALAEDGRPHHLRYEDHLIFALRDFHSHGLIAEATRSRGVKVWNASTAGRLDMYPRVDFEKLFG